MNRRLVLALAAALALPALGSARAADPMPVTASFSVLADLVRQVGGDRVAVATLVGPGGDAHVYQPTPADAKALAASKLLVVNGLGFEGWMTRLQKSSGFKGLVVTASAGIKPQQMDEEEHGHGHARGKKVNDPHAWQSLANGRIYVANIRDGLVKADPEGKAAYEANASRLLAQIDALEPEVRAAIQAIPAARRKLVTSHDAFGYFATAYGLDFLAPAGVSTESEASAADVAKIIRQVKAEKIPAVFVETITDKRLLEQIAKESGARIGGALYSDSLSAPGGPAATYLDMFRHNVRTLTEALAPAS
jgi:zinc/manganese transport system substrate-binding protein